MEDSHLDGQIWEKPEVYYGIRALGEKLDHFEGAMQAFLVGSLNTWQRFAEEYREGGAVALASPEDRARAWMPRTNCINEGALGAKRVYARKNPKGTDATFNNLKMYIDNDTSTFSETHFIDEDYAYLRRLAREQDKEHRQCKINMRLADHTRKTADQNREKAAKKQQKIDDAQRILDGIVLVLDEKLVDGMKTAELEQQLAKFRDLGFVKQLKSHLKNNATRKQVLKDAILRYKATPSPNFVQNNPNTSLHDESDDLEVSDEDC